LVEMKDEGLIQMQNGILQVTDTGRAFIRNVCQLFDQRMMEKGSAGKPSFSLSI
jgi:coproporphyrinogen III oxidase-like Fe-S oxidoreductase